MIYKVYAGSFKKEEYALNQAYKLFSAGYDVIGTKSEKYIRLQVGAFTVKENAQAFVVDLNTKGFPAFIEEADEGDTLWRLSYLMQKQMN